MKQRSKTTPGEMAKKNILMHINSGNMYQSTSKIISNMPKGPTILEQHQCQKAN